MKKMNRALLGSLALSMVLFTSCRKLPPLDNLSSDFVVQTNFDTSADFASYKTFAVRDTITLATDNPNDSLWYDADAQTLVNEVVNQMEAYGYTQVPINEKPDLGLQLIAVRNRTIYGVAPGYWWGFPGYADPCYWGNCSGYPYWYPYWYTFSITTGGLIIEMADLKDAPKIQKLNIVWSGTGSGLLGDSKSFFINQCNATIDQAFAQSQYLNTAIHH